MVLRLRLIELVHMRPSTPNDNIEKKVTRGEIFMEKGLFFVNVIAHSYCQLPGGNNDLKPQQPLFSLSLSLWRASVCNSFWNSV